MGAILKLKKAGRSGLSPTLGWRFGARLMTMKKVSYSVGIEMIRKAAVEWLSKLLSMK
jgi:hypothetical protein